MPIFEEILFNDLHKKKATLLYFQTKSKIKQIWASQQSKRLTKKWIEFHIVQHWQGIFSLLLYKNRQHTSDASRVTFFFKKKTQLIHLGATCIRFSWNILVKITWISFPIRSLQCISKTTIEARILIKCSTSMSRSATKPPPPRTVLDFWMRTADKELPPWRLPPRGTKAMKRFQTHIRSPITSHNTTISS